MKTLQDSLTTIDRLTAKTPAFFKKLQVLGVIIASVSGALMSAQRQGVELPGILELIANWSTIIAGVIAAMVSQLTVDMEAYKSDNALD